ncbi:MAG: DNA polymerase III subunit delta [Blastochloris sp.]|nr:DNA polymerase III subunit delta [Blastochloris sp.]
MADSSIKLKQKHILVNGSDDFQVKSRGLELVAQLTPAEVMNYEVIEGQADSVGDALDKIDRVKEAILTLPFFGGAKLIFLKNCNFLSDNVMGKSEAVLEKLGELTALLIKIGPDSAQVIITATGIDRRRSFYKQFEKIGVCEQWDLPDLKDAAKVRVWMKQIEHLMTERGMKPQPGVVERLVELIGNDTRALHNELEKLALYTMPTGEVSEAHLRLIVSSTRELLVWDLCDAVTESNTNDSLHILRQLLTQGESEVGILILLAGQIRLAALGTHLLESKKLILKKNGTFLNASLAGDAEDLMPQNKKGEKPNLFRLARVVDKARRSPSQRWFRALDVLYQTNLALVSTGSDRQKVLEMAVLKICHTA